MYTGRYEQARARSIEVYRRLENVSTQEVPYVDALRDVMAAAVALLEVLLGPLDEVFDVRRISMAAVVLTPGELAVEQAGVDRRHFLVLIVVGGA